MTSDKEAAEAYRKLKDYCDGQENCTACLFADKIWKYQVWCIFVDGRVPAGWPEEMGALSEQTKGGAVKDRTAHRLP